MISTPKRGDSVISNVWLFWVRLDNFQPKVLSMATNLTMNMMNLIPSMLVI